jgi:predicted ATPase
LEERLHAEPHTRLRYFCSPHSQDSALFPFIDQLGRASGFARDDPPASKLEKLEALLARAAPADEDLALLADLLSLPASDRHPLPSLSPQRKKERTLEALIRQLEGLARRQPVMMVFEDAHWIDPTSRELLDLAVEHVPRLPVLLIVTFRPEFQPPWTGQPQVTTLSLRRLGPEESDQLVRGIIGNATALSMEVVNEIVERTDGVPLFLEELTKAVMENAVVSTIPAISLPVPGTLHASLMARLDRLGTTAKEVAEVGAAIGREFSYELLAAVADRPEAELGHAIQTLVEAGLVFQVTVLMHIKGYGAPDTKAATDRARSLIENAEAVGESPEDPLLLFSVLYSSWVGNIAAFDGDAALELSGQFLTLAEKRGTSGPLMLAHRMVGMTLLSIGELADARAHLDRAIELYNPAEHRSLAARFGADARVAILEWRSRALWLLGYPEAALKDVAESFRSAQEIRQAATLMHALAHSTATLILRGDYAESSARARELVGLAKDKGSLYWKANGMMWEGCRSALTGSSSDAIETLTSALAGYRSTGATVYTPFVLSHLARAYAGLVQHREAWSVIDEAITATAKTKEKWSEAEIHRTAGDLALILPEANAAQAEAHFERALAVARRQQAKSWELRAATSLSRLWRDRGKSAEARELLAPIYSWFTEGFDTPDLEEARALLDALA